MVLLNSLLRYTRSSNQPFQARCLVRSSFSSPHQLAWYLPNMVLLNSLLRYTRSMVETPILQHLSRLLMTSPGMTSCGGNLWQEAQWNLFLAWWILMTRLLIVSTSGSLLEVLMVECPQELLQHLMPSLPSILTLLLLMWPMVSSPTPWGTRVISQL